MTRRHPWDSDTIPLMTQVEGISSPLSGALSEHWFSPNLGQCPGNADPEWPITLSLSRGRRSRRDLTDHRIYFDMQILIADVFLLGTCWRIFAFSTGEWILTDLGVTHSSHWTRSASWNKGTSPSGSWWQEISRSYWRDGCGGCGGVFHYLGHTEYVCEQECNGSTTWSSSSLSWWFSWVRFVTDSWASQIHAWTVLFFLVWSLHKTLLASEHRKFSLVGPSAPSRMESLKSLRHSHDIVEPMCTSNLFRAERYIKFLSAFVCCRDSAFLFSAVSECYTVSKSTG